jgi:Fe/S biogenesis protein NfuA
MIQMTPAAQQHFRKLVEQQGISDLGIRLRAIHPGTPAGDCELGFCEPSDLTGDEWEVQCAGFSLFVDASSVPYLDGAEIDFDSSPMGGQLSIRAPALRGSPPGDSASLVERVRYLLETEIAPGLAAHGGRVSLVEISADGVVVLQFGGGCHGCGMVDATLRNGIERTLRERIPEISAVHDATDHATGRKPYFSRPAGRAP